MKEHDDEHESVSTEDILEMLKKAADEESTLHSVALFLLADHPEIQKVYVDGLAKTREIKQRMVALNKEITDAADAYWEEFESAVEKQGLSIGKELAGYKSTAIKNGVVYAVVDNQPVRG